VCKRTVGSQPAWRIASAGLSIGVAANHERQLTDMRTLLWVISAVVITLTGSACGGSDKPNTTTAPTPTTTALTISSPNVMVFVGGTEQMTASATLSNGTLSTPTGTWGSDASAVATVNGSGLVTGVGSGNTTVFFVSGGRQGTKLLRGLPNYGGNWSGTYQIVGCQQSGTFAAINGCGTFTGVAPYSFGANQTEDRVTGTVLLGSIAFGTFASTVNPSGGLGLSVFHTPTSSTDFTWNSTWNLSSSSTGVMGGTLLNNISGGGFSGSMTLNGNIVAGNRRVTGEPLTTSGVVIRSFDDLFNAMRR
jgi:hypothetical protein